MHDHFRTLSADELLRLWSRPPEEWTDTLRQDALWEYWRRVAAGGCAFCRAVFEKMLRERVVGMSEVVGELAVQGRLPIECLRRSQLVLSTLETSSAAWALSQLSARDTLERLRSETRDKSRISLEPLFAKGTYWAALQAIPLLDADGLSRFKERLEHERVFSRRQRHQLRQAVRAEEEKAKQA
jgi:hypothetical protein